MAWNKPDLEPYRTLPKAEPLVVGQEAARRGLSPMAVIYVLREVCGMSTGDAKGVLHQVWPEMHFFHTQLLADLDKVHAEMDKENGTS